MRRLASRKINRLSARLSRRGIFAQTVSRLVPPVPFALFNPAVGAFRVPFRDYMLGTLLGEAPAVGAITLFAHWLGMAARQPTMFNLAMAGMITLAVLSSVLVMRRLLDVAGRRSLHSNGRRSVSHPSGGK